MSKELVPLMYLFLIPIKKNKLVIVWYGEKACIGEDSKLCGQPPIQRLVDILSSAASASVAGRLEFQCGRMVKTSPLSELLLVIKQNDKHTYDYCIY